MKTISATALPGAQLEQLEAVAADLPDEIHHLLSSLVASLREGADIVAFDAAETLTASTAAEQLNISRTHLYRLLDNGTIPSHRVGRDRRIAARDLLTFAAQRDAERRELAERFLDQETIRAGAIEEISDLL